LLAKRKERGELQPPLASPVIPRRVSARLCKWPPSSLNGVNVAAFWPLGGIGRSEEKQIAKIRCRQAVPTLALTPPPVLECAVVVDA
jgi:hypothetical protein